MPLSSPQYAGYSYSDLSSLPEFYEIANRRFALEPVVLQPSYCGKFIWVFANGGAQRCFGRPSIAEFPAFIGQLNEQALARREETLARAASAARGSPEPDFSNSVPNLDIDL